MAQVQLDLFMSAKECELSSIIKTVEDVKKSSDSVRKGTYARINELKRDYNDIKYRLEIMEHHICKGK